MNWGVVFGWLTRALNRGHQRRLGGGVFSKGGGLGDELMVLCAIQAVRRKQPALDIAFCARNHQLLNGAIGVGAVRSFDSAAAARTGIGISYSERHELPILKQMTAQMGVPDADDFSLELPERPLCLPGGWPPGDELKILVQVSGSGWTPNKQWPLDYWRKFIESLPEELSIIELGTHPAFPSPPGHPGWCSLAGQTSLEEFASCFRACGAFVGPVSGGMHLAHAFRVPSVIITGGYEAANFPYPLAIQLGTGIECAPCWLRTPCPYDRRCLREITPERVAGELMKQIGTPAADQL